MKIRQAELSEIEFRQQKCLEPNRNSEALRKALQGSLSGIATFIKLSNGKYHVLSRYEDDNWYFRADEGASDTVANKLKLDFTRIHDANAKAMAKWIIWNQKLKGNAVGSLRNSLNKLVSFFSWLSKSDTLAVQGLNAFSAQQYVLHVNAMKTKRKGQWKPLVPGTKTMKFLALENIHQYCHPFEFVEEHPWPESSASEQAGLVGAALAESQNKPKTLIIPDDTLKALCSFTKGFLDRADELLDLNEALLLLRDSCLFWILLTTGMRIHEVLGIKRGAYRKETKDDETYYYIETVSKKTYTGLAEWIAPKIAIDAIKILERYSSDLQTRVEADLASARARNDHEEVNRLENITNKVCLSHTKAGSSVTVLSGDFVTEGRLPNLCAKIGSDWNLSSHQFRRTFANYVVHSQLGDIRALKDHFKHWSIQMTALYAYNDKLDQELFEELLREQYWLEEQIKFDWFGLDSPLAGGAIAERIMKVRGDEEHIKTFKTREDMVRAYSGNIPIRATGIAWCTNDDDGCMGGKCDECDHGIIDKNNQKHWEGMLIQQFDLSQMDDIGEAGQAAVANGMARCENVLTSLGIDVDKMKVDIGNNNQ
ncbi:site-specific integrase [Paraglaciecola sp.]|uniref:site-specific integrase n=1 Tax=Paraglaciecola sp. TaxID=1920173 RepID=UPI003EF2F409